MAKNLPGISSKLPGDVRQFLDRVREFISTTAADFVSRSELESAGVITTDAYGRTLGGSQEEASQLAPPAALGVTATGAMSSILVEWLAANYPNHAYAEIWASGTDDLGAAVMVGESTATMFAHAVGTGVTRYYWIRFVSTANVPGPFNAVAGVHGQTSNDPAWMLSVLAGQLSESQLVLSLNKRINMIEDHQALLRRVNIGIESAAEAALKAALKASRIDKTLTDAGIVTNPDTGVVYIYGLEEYKGANDARLSSAELRLSGAEAEISLKASVTYVDAAIATAVIDPSQIAALGDIYVRLSAAELAIDGAEASIVLKASQTEVDGHESRITTAEGNISVLQGQISLKASTSTVNAIDSRLNTAETTLATYEAAEITQQVASIRQIRRAQDAQAEATLRNLLLTVDQTDTLAVSVQVQQQAIDGIHGLYIVKIDNNGVMSGFALASDVIADGSVLSKFILSVDQFAVIAPGRTAGQLNSVPFAVLTTAQTINGVTFEPGVYIDGGSINHLSVGTAQLADLAVDNAKIANLSAEKITAGDVDADRMRANIVSAASGQFDTLSALSAALGTVLIDESGWLKTNGVTSFASGDGVFLGYDAGFYKFRAGNTTDRFVSWDGNDLTIKAAGLTIEDGAATFSGHLEAASGTFIGSLAGADITGSTGVFSGTLAAGVIDSSALAGVSMEVTRAGLISYNGLSVVPVTEGVFTFTVPTNANWSASTVKCRVTLCGGGAGGGGGAAHYPIITTAVPGAGGGSGGLMVGYEIAVTMGETLTLYIGDKGTGGSVAFNAPDQHWGLDGTDGGATYIARGVTTLASANGGKAGKGGNPHIQPMIDAQGGNRGTVSAGENSGHDGADGIAAHPYMGLTFYPGGLGGAGFGAYGNGGDGGAAYDTTSTYWGEEGTPGYAYIEIYDSSFVVTNDRYSELISWLDGLGHGAVPAGAR